MNIFEKIKQKRKQIIPELYEWAETFDWEFDEDGEKTNESYTEVFELVQRLENDECDTNDYKNILFHIEQINYNEIKIKL
ncbi:MAG: hypothetical protein IPN09_11920 [Bacteroidetes bacterium]|nr:hypothetical protein [Bacteroidota bacterium]